MLRRTHDYAHLFGGGGVLLLSKATESNTPIVGNTDASTTQDSQVLYTSNSYFNVTIPKQVVLDGNNKTGNYSVKVSGDIASNQTVKVSARDDVADKAGINFYMKDTNKKKADVLAMVTHSKTDWNYQNVRDSFVSSDNSVSAPNLTAGDWHGSLVFQIELNSNLIVAKTYPLAPEGAIANWNYTLDDVNNIVTLNYYTGNETDVIVYGRYPIGVLESEKIYKTQLASNIADATYDIPYMFNGNTQVNCKNIKTITFSNSIDTGNVTNMNSMFYNCESLTSLDVSSFDTSNVTDMNWMFNGCAKLMSLDISSFNTSKVTRMRSVFYFCKSLTSLDVSSFDTSNVTIMKSMFSLCASLTSLDLSNFNTSNVTNMRSMFYNCESLTSLDVSSFDTSNVTNMGYMFGGDWSNKGCTSLTSLNLSNFDTSNVTDMSWMFAYCASLTSLDLSSFDTSNVTNMYGMFEESSNLKTIYATSGKWVTSQANTDWMFYDCGTSSVTYK